MAGGKWCWERQKESEKLKENVEEYREEKESKEKTVTIHKCCLADKHQLDSRMNCETVLYRHQTVIDQKW